LTKPFFTLENWPDDGWLVGGLKEVPSVFSQGESLKELKENIADGYRMMLESDAESSHEGLATLELGEEPFGRACGARDSCQGG